MTTTTMITKDDKYNIFTVSKFVDNLNVEDFKASSLAEAKEILNA